MQTINSTKAAPKLAVIGCGAITESFYLPALADHLAIMQQVVLVDVSKNRTEYLCKKFNIQASTNDYKTLLNGAVDGAIIAVPHHLHYAIAKDFLAKGIDVLCEKPLCEYTKQARELVTIAHETQAQLSVNYTRRLFPSYQNIKSIIAQGQLGDITAIRYYEGGVYNWPTSSGFYFNSQESPKGVLLDRGPHVLDLVCWWLGAKPQLLRSENDSYGGPEAVGYVEFQHEQCVGEVRLSWLSRLENRYYIQGTTGAIEGDISDWRSFKFMDRKNKSKQLKFKSNVRYFAEFGKEMVANFIDVVRSSKSPIVAGHEVIDSVEFIEECYKNAQRFYMPWDQSLKRELA
jgi:predicted dehydrogenase